MPASVQLLGQTFAIELVNRDADVLRNGADMENIGTVRLVTQTISIAEDLASDQERDTLLHECLHALCRIVNLVPKAAEEERLVVALAPLLLDALRRNPAIVKYLVAA